VANSRITDRDREPLRKVDCEDGGPPDPAADGAFPVEHPSPRGLHPESFVARFAVERA
jgi:hypothetical protein